MCPFCYIGKKNFENALNQFADKQHIEVKWKSFQLDPRIPETPQESYKDYLVVNKGISPEQAAGTLDRVAQTAQQAGLEFNFDKAVMVNSFKAHKLIQLAKTKKLGQEAEELLFKAFFTEGKNLADNQTLIEIGETIGLETAEIQQIFESDKFAELVQKDIQEARQIGVTGVPFFVIDRKYAVSGAQPSEVFLQTLQQSFEEWRKLNPESPFKVIQGQSCSTDGVCD